MKVLYRPVAVGVQAALKDIFVMGFPADKVIQRSLMANRKWGSQDRRLFAEAVYDLVRWWRRILFCVDVGWPKVDRWAVDDSEVTAKAIGLWCALNEVELDRALGAPGMAGAVKIWRDQSLPRAVRESMPDWLDRLGERELGAKWDEILPTLNGTAPAYLRVNRLKTTPAKLVDELKSEGVVAKHVADDCLELEKRSNIFKSKSFSAGAFEMQDRNSQLVAPALQAEAGMRVVDACAGAGGKSLHLAALMQNKGKVLALDVQAKRLEQLRERSTRAGASCIETRLIDSSKVIKRLKESADRVLLDVPCTGLGVLRRNPDSKWKLSEAELVELQSTQAAILKDYASMCRPGGILVYATCSILPSENGRPVAQFLAQNEATWKMEQELVLWPAPSGPDGFYLARLRKS